jgi:hypothetical protein
LIFLLDRIFNNIIHNQSILSNIDDDECDIEEIQRLIKINKRLADYLAERDILQPKRKGRPKKNDYYTEPILPINSVNDLIPILQKQAQVAEPVFRERVTVK